MEDLAVVSEDEIVDFIMHNSNLPRKVVIELFRANISNYSYLQTLLYCIEALLIKEQLFFYIKC
jgi:hypothetical protein